LNMVMNTAINMIMNAVMNTLMNLRVPHDVENFLTAWGPASLSGTAVFMVLQVVGSSDQVPGVESRVFCGQCSGVRIAQSRGNLCAGWAKWNWSRVVGINWPKHKASAVDSWWQRCLAVWIIQSLINSRDVRWHPTGF